MATMTVSEAYYIVFDIVAAELQGGCHGHRHHPVSALKGYDIVEICTAFKLQVANEFVLYANRDVFEEKVGEEKFAKGVKLYDTGPLNVVANFVADDQVDVVGAKPAFEFDDPLFLSQETASSFAEYCKSVGADDPIYWERIYARLGLEYTATSPRGNKSVDPTSRSYSCGSEPAPREESKPTMTTSNQFGEEVKKLVGGILWILVACWFVYYWVGNPLDEFALIRRAQIAAGSLVETVESEQEDHRGRVWFSDVGVYTYRLPDGREFKATHRVPTGELEERQEVEYLPDDPAVSRIRGDGCQSVIELLWRKVLLGGILLAGLSWFGVAMMRDAICDMMTIRTDATALPHWCRGHWLDE